MITTEETLVYSLIESLRASELNNDEVIEEREIRTLLRSYRATIINKESSKGMYVDESCYQPFEINLSAFSENELIGEVPSLIYLPEKTFVKIKSLGFINIPLLDEESYYLSKKNVINKYHAKAFIKNNKLYIYVGAKNNYGKLTALMADCLTKRKQIIIEGILDNPDDGLNYDWTSSPYPLPISMLDDLKDKIHRKEFQFYLNTKSDQIGNFKNDYLRYHDQGKPQY